MRSKELVVGLVIVAGIAVLVLGTLFLKGTQIGQETREVEAVFREVGLATTGNDVRFRGVPIGTIREIAVQPDGGGVLVRMRIEEEITLPEDAAAVLSPESMFGDWQAQIVSMSRFPRYDFFQTGDPEVLPGHTIPDFTVLAATADVIAQDIAILAERFELAFTEETARNLKAAIDNISATTAGLSDLIEQQAATFERVALEVQEAANEMENAARSTDYAVQRVDSILSSQRMDQTLTNVAEMSENFRAASDELTLVAEDLREGVLQAADSTLGRIDRITARLEAGEGALGWLLHDTTFVVQTQDLLTQLSELLADVQENPQRYINLSIF